MESVKSGSNVIEPSFILSVIGGAFMLVGGILAVSMFSLWTPIGSPGWHGGMMSGGGWGGMMSGGFMGATLGTVAGISIGAGIVSIVGGYSIYKKPESSSTWGVAILISGIVGLIGMSGFFIGSILGIIGGILALTRK
jgi:hypothetical protein